MSESTGIPGPKNTPTKYPTRVYKTRHYRRQAEALEAYSPSPLRSLSRLENSPKPIPEEDDELQIKSIQKSPERCPKKREKPVAMGAICKLVLVTLLARCLYVRLNGLGYFRTDIPDADILTIFDGYECKDGEQMKGQGAEDMAVTSDNVALITSGLLWPVFQEQPKNGKIYSLDLENPKLDQFKQVPILNVPADFHLTPHGLDIFETDDGRTLVYVVNHGSTLPSRIDNQEAIIKFEYDHDKNTLNFINEFKAAEILSVNDLTVISEDEFYFTNDSGFPHSISPIIRVLEMLVPPFITYAPQIKGFSSIGYCNDGECKLVSKHWHLPNGIQHRRNGDQIKLYISDVRIGVQIYNVEQDNNIKFVKELEAGELGVVKGVDNITKMPNGKLYANAQGLKWDSNMKFLEIINPLYHPIHQTVNQIFEIDSNDEAKRIFFSGDSQHITSLSASVVTENYVLLGNPFTQCTFCSKINAK